MISSLFLEQLSLVGALSALVLAVFWPHVATIFRRSAKTFISFTTNIHEDEGSSIDNKIGRPTLEHPRLNGRTLSKKKTSLIIGPNYQDQFTDANSLPAFAKNSRYPSHNGQSSLSLTIFTAFIVAIIVYTLLKMLTGRFGSGTRGEVHESSYGKHMRKPTTTDLRRDRRKITRLSREERARKLILHHGGKNVSNAIRFLVAELEKQKQQLLEDNNKLSDNSSTCSCSCTCHIVDSESGNQRDSKDANLILQNNE